MTMKAIVFLLLALLPLHAQVDVSKSLEEGMREAVAGLAPVAAEDKAAVLSATATMLAKHVTFRADGSASSNCVAPGVKQQVEWRKLVVRSISNQTVSEADRLNGISRRFFVSLDCDAHRRWDAKKNAWTEWLPVGNPIFLRGITVEWKSGAWTALESDQMKWFLPGPDLPSVTREPNPKTKSPDLPPGMTRGK